jgi:hypothetical protein
MKLGISLGGRRKLRSIGCRRNTAIASAEGVVSISRLIAVNDRYARSLEASDPGLFVLNGLTTWVESVFPGTFG